MLKAFLVAEILFPLGDLIALDLLGAEVLLLALAGEDLDIHDGALDARRHGEGGVLHIRGLLAEDGAQQLLLGGQDGLALGRDFTDKNIPVTNRGADADDARIV